MTETNTSKNRAIVIRRTGLAFASVVIIAGITTWKSLSNVTDMLKPGTMAPPFVLTSASGTSVRLADSIAVGHKTVLVFYPGDNTPVCTAQLCALRDNWDALKAAGADVFGINPADKDKHNLPQ